MIWENVEQWEHDVRFEVSVYTWHVPSLWWINISYGEAIFRTVQGLQCYLLHKNPISFWHLLSHWETKLHFNVGFHWPRPCPEWSLKFTGFWLYDNGYLGMCVTARTWRPIQWGFLFSRTFVHGPFTRYVKLRVAHAWRTCRDACRDRWPAVAGKTSPAFPAHAHPQFYVSGKGPLLQQTRQIGVNHVYDMKISIWPHGH